MNNLSPQWRAFKVEAGRLCSCDRSRTIFLSVYDWDKDGTHDLLGQCRATFAELETLAANGGNLKLTHPKMSSGNAVGTLVVGEARVSDEVERELLCLRAQIGLNQAATYSAINAHENALKAAKGALLLLLKGHRLSSEFPVPHDSAVTALLRLPMPIAVLLSVAYATIAAEHRTLGYPAEDAQTTADKLAAQLQNRAADDRELAAALTAAANSFACSHARPASPTRATSPARRMLPHKRGWTPSGRSSPSWRSPAAAPLSSGLGQTRAPEIPSSGGGSVNPSTGRRTQEAGHLGLLPHVMESVRPIHADRLEHRGSDTHGGATNLRHGLKHHQPLAVA